MNNESVCVLKSKRGDGEGKEKRFLSTCPTAQKKMKTRFQLCVCSQNLAEHKKKSEELNCVYKSDNCWETKSFMVEFLTLSVFFSFPLFCLLFREGIFLCDFFSPNICNRTRESIGGKNFLFSCDTMVWKEEKRKILSGERRRKVVSFHVNLLEVFASYVGKFDANFDWQLCKVFVRHVFTFFVQSFTLHWTHYGSKQAKKFLLMRQKWHQVILIFNLLLLWSDFSPRKPTKILTNDSFSFLYPTIFLSCFNASKFIPRNFLRL